MSSSLSSLSSDSEESSLTNRQRYERKGGAREAVAEDSQAIKNAVVPAALEFAGQEERVGEYRRFWGDGEWMIEYPRNDPERTADVAQAPELINSKGRITWDVTGLVPDTPDTPEPSDDETVPIEKRQDKRKKQLNAEPAKKLEAQRNAYERAERHEATTKAILASHSDIKQSVKAIKRAQTQTSARNKKAKTSDVLQKVGVAEGKWSRKGGASADGKQAEAGDEVEESGRVQGKGKQRAK